MSSLFASAFVARTFVARAVILGAFLLLSVYPSLAAPNVAGLWLTPGRDAVVEISRCDDGLCGRIVGLFLDHASDPMPVDYRGVSQCGLPLITDARQIRLGLWKGHITDPRNGNVWGVELHLDPHGNLALRGFFGIPLLGRTQIWTRYPGRPPADCRIGPTRTVTGQSGGLRDKPGSAQ
jgi:uncharacterized protein (DUF2147 family)